MDNATPQPGQDLKSKLYYYLESWPQEMTAQLFTAKTRILVTDLRDLLGAEYKSARTGLPRGHKERGWYVRKAGRYELLLSDDITITAITLGPLNIGIESGKLYHKETLDHIARLTDTHTDTHTDKGGNMITAIVNQKGGVGKTTTAHALGAGLTKRKRKVLFIDLDAQCNLSYTLGAVNPAITSLDLLHGSQASQAVIKTPDGDLIPASPFLAGVDIELTGPGKEKRLQTALAPIAKLYDHVIIDTPPALGILTLNALTAAGQAIITAQADLFSLQGIGALWQTIDAIRKLSNPGLEIAGILLTRYSPRAILTREITDSLDQTAATLGAYLYKAKIREAIAVKEAQISHKSIFDYAPKSNPALDYDAFIKEYLKRI